MAKRHYRYRKRGGGLNWPDIIICALLLAAVAILIIGENYPETGLPSWSEVYDALEEASGSRPSEKAPSLPASGAVRVHFLDTGQSDCILITTPEKNVLIDAGDRGMGAEIVSYITAQGVEKLDLVIATHPHADHIGSMAYVINKLEVTELLLPELTEDMTPTTQIYESLLDAAEAGGCAVTAARPGLKYALADGAALTVLGPAGVYDDLNNWSVVTRLTVGGRAFLFMGDAEKAAEADMIATGAELDCDVLKAGHHGSDTSSGDALLDASTPEYAVICVGAGNDYGHPLQSVLDRYAQRGIKVYRTDLDGAVVAETDGGQITFTTEG